MSGFYKEVLLDHFHRPRNHGDLAGLKFSRRGTNPRCGDEIEIGFNITDDKIEPLRFRGRGCSVCIASASLMTDMLTGKSVEQVKEICREMIDWFSNKGLDMPESLAEGLMPLTVIKSNPARQRCVLLSWQALSEELLKIHADYNKNLE